jgi:hypothetical protein
MSTPAMKSRPKTSVVPRLLRSETVELAKLRWLRDHGRPYDSARLAELERKNR